MNEKVPYHRSIVAFVGARLVLWALRDYQKRARAMDAENYVEASFIRKNGERIAVTIVKPGKKTPHELRREAEADTGLWKETAKVRDLHIDYWRTIAEHE